MILHKAKAYITEDDKAYIAEREQIISDTVNQLQTLAEREKNGVSTDELLSNSEQVAMLWDIYQTASDEINTRRRITEERYIASFNNDIEAVLADIAEIADAFTKKDYLLYYKAQREVSEYYASNVDDPKAKKNILGLHKRGYNDCLLYLKVITRVQLNALYRIHENTENDFSDPLTGEYKKPVKELDRANAILEAKAGTLYRKPKNPAPRTIKTKSELAERYQAPDEKKLFSMPTSPAINLIQESLIHGSNLKEIGERKKAFNHSASYELQGQGNSRRLTKNTDKGTVTLEIPDINQVVGNNKTAKKLFTYAIIKANEQAVFNGELGRNYITFPLQELVKLGMYKNDTTARRGFDAGASLLTSLKVKGSIRKSPKSVASIETLEVLFTGANIKNGQCTLYLNERINWGFLFQYFTIMPRESLKLQNRAFDLCHYVFTRARQLKGDIEKKGYFTISFRAIQERLALPSEVGNRRPQQLIKQPIDEAIANIEATLRTADIELLTVVNEDAPIKEWLDTGYLRVTLKGEYAREFIALSKEQRKQIDNRRKRTDRITEKAIAMRMANSDKLDNGNPGTSS